MADASPPVASQPEWNKVRPLWRGLWPWLGLLLPMVFLFRDYIIADFNLLMAVVALPMVAGFEGGKPRARMGWVALGMGILFLLLGIQFPLLFGAGFLLMFIAEQQSGRMNLLPIALLAWLSPVQVYASQVLGASLRMQLSEWAVGILRFMGNDVVAQGNRFEWAGQVFYVDPACAGLDMLLTTAIFALLFAGYFEKRKNRKVGWVGLGLLMGWVIAWVILANLFRIVGIVLAQAPPETLLHEAVGIGSLILYGILPAGIGAFGAVRWLSRPFTRQAYTLQPFTSNTKWIVWMAMATLWGIWLFRPAPVSRAAMQKPNLPGFEQREAQLGVAGYLSDQSLVFIKPPVPFWGADHTPAICWRTEGYQLRGERAGSVCGAPVWIAELHKPGEILYTAWWYDNQREIVAGQWDWRWNTAKGNGPYRLVNVTVANLPDLLPEADRVMALLAPAPNFPSAQGQ